MEKFNLNKIIADNLEKDKFQSKSQPSLKTNGWLDAYKSGGTYISDSAKATQFGQYKRGGGYFPEYHSYAPPRMDNGGDISIPDLNSDKWLMKYDVGGPGDPYIMSPINFKAAADNTHIPYSLKPQQDSFLTAGFNYKDYYDKANTYLSRPTFKGSSLNAKDIADAAQDFYKKTSYTYPLDLLLTQGQMESGLGTKLKSKNNFFNVGNTDNGSTKDFSTPKDSVYNYIDLMYNDYLNKGQKTPDDLLKPKGFVNTQGNRYASAPNYETELANQRKFIQKKLGLYGPGGQTTDGCPPGFVKDARGQCVLEGLNKSVNSTDVIGKTESQKLKEKLAAEELHRANIAEGKRQFIGQAKASTPESEARRKRLNQQFAAQLPNAQYNEQTGEVSRVNPDRSVTGEAENFMSRREDKAAEHALGALEAAGYATGIGELADLGYGAAKNALNESMESGILSSIDKKIYPTRVYRAEVPGGNPKIYSTATGKEAELANKVFNKGDWATKDLSESFQYLKGTEAFGGKEGLVKGSDMYLTEYKVPFWKKNVSFDPDVQALKKLQEMDINPNEYIIPGKTALDKFMYPRRTNLIKAVPENLKLTDQLYSSSSFPLSPNSYQFASQPYKYVEDQINAVTGHQMPITFDTKLGVDPKNPIYNWQQPQFAPNSGFGTFKRFGPGGQTSDGCPAGYNKHPLTGECIPNGWVAPMQSGPTVQNAERLRKAEALNRTTTGPVINQSHSDEPWRQHQAAEMRRQAAQQNSDLAQTMALFTPSGSNTAAGVRGAETFVNMNPLISGPIMSASRLYGAGRSMVDPNTYNPYFSSDRGVVGNIMGGLNLAGDIGMVRTSLRNPSGNFNVEPDPANRIEWSDFSERNERVKDAWFNNQKKKAGIPTTKSDYEKFLQQEKLKKELGDVIRTEGIEDPNKGGWSPTHNPEVEKIIKNVQRGNIPLENSNIVKAKNLLNGNFPGFNIPGYIENLGSDAPMYYKAPWGETINVSGIEKPNEMIPYSGMDAFRSIHPNKYGGQHWLNKYDTGGGTEYIVKPGDNLSRISKNTGVSVRQLTSANNLTNPNLIRVNQKLVIPTIGGTQPQQSYQSWDDIRNRENQLNSLQDNNDYSGDEQRITQYYSNRPDDSYVVVDKKKARMDVYKGNKLLKSYEVGTGANPGDAQTVTRRINGKTDWTGGNKSTGAGVYTISNVDPKSKEYFNLPAFNLKNDQGIEVATTIHGTPLERRAKFDNGTIADNRMSNGCINGKCYDLEDLYGRVDVGSKVFILPEDEGNSIQIVDGKPVLKVNPKNRAKYSQYVDQTGTVRKGQGINQSVNTLQYKPIVGYLDKKAFQNDVYQWNDLNDEDEYQNTTKPYFTALVNNKKKIMEATHIPSDVYNEIAKMSFGIYGTESNFGDTHSAVGNFGRAVAKAFNPTGSSSPDYQSKATTYGADAENNSVGLTQMRWSFLNKEEKDALKKLGVTSNKDLLDPEKAAVATTAVLAIRYNQQLTDSQKKDMWKYLPTKWNTRSNYADRVKKNSKYLSFKQLDSKLKNGGESNLLNRYDIGGPGPKDPQPADISKQGLWGAGTQLIRNMFHDPFTQFITQKPTAELAASNLVDPSGVTNAPFLWQSIGKMYEHPSFTHALGLGLDIAGSIPVFGEAAKVASKTMKEGNLARKAGRVAGKGFKKVVDVVEYPARVVNKVYEKAGVISPFLNNSINMWNRGVHGYDAGLQGLVEGLNYISPGTPQQEYGGQNNNWLNKYK